MSFFRIANPDEVKRIETPDGEGFLELKVEFSKAEINRVVLAAPKNNEDVKGGLNFIERFAEIAVMGWSMTDDKGNPVKFDIKVYQSLHSDAAKWIDEQLAEHLKATIGKDVEDVEGKPLS